MYHSTSSFSVDWLVPSLLPQVICLMTWTKTTNLAYLVFPQSNHTLGTGPVPKYGCNAYGAKVSKPVARNNIINPKVTNL